jgi:signal transduction histidine kinase
MAAKGPFTVCSLQIFGKESKPFDTSFAPAQRAAPGDVEASIRELTGHPVLKAILDATSVSVVVLNRQRQILVGNAALFSTLGIGDDTFIEGMRPGEAFGCVHARQCAGGCGTSPECTTCGAVAAILESQKTASPVERECLMTVRRGDQLEGLELRVTATQIEIGREPFTILGIRDISAEKRRLVLERVFLHDISNTVGALHLRAQVLAQQGPEAPPDAAQRILSLTQRLRRDIEDQRVLMQAENGTLQLGRSPVHPEAALKNAADVVSGHAVARDRTLDVRPYSGIDPIVTDESLLVRVLVNMMKNALEATPPGGVVRGSAEMVSRACEFRVWNAAAIEPRVALQIFKRSFSTKPGGGRGLGTFSMKLFGERYLGGTVGFTSTEKDGTAFFIRLPAASGTTA